MSQHRKYRRHKLTGDSRPISQFYRTLTYHFLGRHISSQEDSASSNRRYGADSQIYSISNGYFTTCSNPWITRRYA